MAYTRNHIVAIVSIVFLIILTAIAGYAASRSNHLSLPIPKSLTGFTAALPLAAGFLLEGGYALSRGGPRRNRNTPSPPPRALFTIIANVLILVYSTVIITLLGTHTGPTSQLLCGLNDRWMSMYKDKNGEAIKAIQDTFQCCGLHRRGIRRFHFRTRLMESRRAKKHITLPKAALRAGGARRRGCLVC